MPVQFNIERSIAKRRDAVHSFDLPLDLPYDLPIGISTEMPIPTWSCAIYSAFFRLEFEIVWAAIRLSYNGYLADSLLLDDFLVSEHISGIFPARFDQNIQTKALIN